MEIQHFRIGNYYQSDKEAKQVEPYTFDCYKYDGLEPVPLTEEWLVKFGWVKHKHGYFNHSKFDYLSLSSDFCYGFENYQLDLPDIKFKYVHQLQNFVFAFTSQELVTNKEDK